MMSEWQTKEALRELLCDLVRVPSISGSLAEKAFPQFLLQKPGVLNYFREHPDDLNEVLTGDGRSFVSAFVRAPANRSDGHLIQPF
ncbi:hypothetical protein M3N64_00045 [Sporolactobacillus sp. CPB3-1]|uniref:Uncharacterized protein n=1 Tax=Sporolactobacillus mangiferae TaxID=2940498 RepID=A0ABT0M650_9BACL|nr:hypothetical protein [Sporolactobacillus mangiferae]MCL1630347.1 hypothetical protein [Sporolactobacillus mangiferae]